MRQKTQTFSKGSEAIPVLQMLQSAVILASVSCRCASQIRIKFLTKFDTLRPCTCSVEEQAETIEGAPHLVVVVGNPSEPVERAEARTGDDAGAVTVPAVEHAPTAQLRPRVSRAEQSVVPAIKTRVSEHARSAWTCVQVCVHPGCIRNCAVLILQNSRDHGRIVTTGTAPPTVAETLVELVPRLDATVLGCPLRLTLTVQDPSEGQIIRPAISEVIPARDENFGHVDITQGYTTCVIPLFMWCLRSEQEAVLKATAVRSPLRRR